MTKPIIKIVDISTGEEINREMTQSEIAQYNLGLAAQEAQANEQAAQEAARQTALDKLKAIGLTDEEIAALVGA